MKYVYITVIALCTLWNTAAQSFAVDAIALHLKYNIPMADLLAADNNVNIAIESLSLKELTEVRV